MITLIRRLAPPVAVAATAIALAVPAAAGGSQSVTFSGSAYGSALHLGSLVQSGQTSQVSVCTTAGGTTKSNTTAAVTVPNVGTIGAVVTRITTVVSPPESSAFAKTGATNLFNGAISAQSITASASVTRNGTDYVTAGKSVLVGLRINGNRISGSPAPNTSINLPGIGRVVLNQQRHSEAYALPTLEVIALVVVVNPHNDQGLPAGVITISDARAGLHKPTYNRESGYAYGTSAQIGNIVKSGRTALVNLPCGGSDGVEVSNTVAQALIPGVLKTGTVTSNGKSTDSATLSTVDMHSRVAGVNLFAGRVRADAVGSHASATLRNGTMSFAGSGSTFIRLVIGGRTITGTPPPNTSYSLPGIGTIYVNVIEHSAHSVQTYALRIVLGSDQGGLPAGSVINIAAASATILA